MQFNKGKGREKGKGKFTYQKGKGKGKGRGKGKDYQGDRNTTDKQEPKVTNNSQRVTYLDPPQHDGDDETTIVFKQHMNRIVSDPTNDAKWFDDSDDETNTLALLNQLLPDEETTQAYRHGRCGLCDKPVTTVDLNPNVELTCEECTQSAGNEQDYVDTEPTDVRETIKPPNNPRIKVGKGRTGKTLSSVTDL